MNYMRIELIEKSSEFKNVKVDAIAHISGGIDSKCATALFAVENPQKKIVLVTYKSAMEIGNEESKKTAAELMKKYKNITTHLIVRIPDETIRKLIIENEYLWKDGLGAFRPCYICSGLWLSAAIYLHKKFFGGDTIIEGMRLAGIDLKEGHVEIRRNFAKEYGLDMQTPVLFYSQKEKIFALAEKLGLSKDGHQGLCLFRKFYGISLPKNNNPRATIKKDKKVEYAKIIDEFQYILEMNDVKMGKDNL